jgi:electron transfer flavoprotein beta subunit
MNRNFPVHRNRNYDPLMNIAVLLAGIADPKRPLPRPPENDWRNVVDAADFAFSLSPFDEAALEIGLKLRTAQAGSTLTVLLSDGAVSESLMRALAAFRPDHLIGIARPAAERWQPAALTRRVVDALAGLTEQPDVMLVGREHGDADDGVVAPYLAESLGRAYAGLVLSVQARDGGIACTRAAADGEEIIALPFPALISISNDKGNRLRHPLLKNVMLAKQQKFSVLDSNPALPQRVVLTQAGPPPATQAGHAPCRMLQGTLSEQAHELAEYLNPWIEDAVHAR